MLKFGKADGCCIIISNGPRVNDWHITYETLAQHKRYFVSNDIIAVQNCLTELPKLSDEQILGVINHLLLHAKVIFYESVITTNMEKIIRLLENAIDIRLQKPPVFEIVDRSRDLTKKLIPLLRSNKPHKQFPDVRLYQIHLIRLSMQNSDAILRNEIELRERRLGKLSADIAAQRQTIKEDRDNPMWVAGLEQMKIEQGRLGGELRDVGGLLQRKLNSMQAEIDALKRQIPRTTLKLKRRKRTRLRYRKLNESPLQRKQREIDELRQQLSDQQRELLELRQLQPKVSKKEVVSRKPATKPKTPRKPAAKTTRSKAKPKAARPPPSDNI